ncbi:MAG TPA: hypothetical protein VI387_01315 [Candidatus Brocadiales bacterium]|nr:hypothetical protein [Candidatus Brocadiales bacterium]
MPITKEIIKKVAEDAGISIDELTLSGFLSFLREKRRRVMLDRLDVLTRYGVASIEELEKKVKDGAISEHPAWEDLILLENLESAITAIDEDIKAVQESS